MRSLDPVATLQNLLDRHATVAASELVRTEGKRVVCLACGHRCQLSDGARGICKVRWAEAGLLRVPSGYVAGIAVDPIEKKPFFHVDPGSDALSFGTLGCDLHCGYCQNWDTSQSLRDRDASGLPHAMTASEIIEVATARDCSTVVSTYNEPLITAEWSHEVFSLAKERGLRTGFVSNGNATPEVLDWLRPVMDLYKVDLKSFRDKSYRSLGCPLQNVLDGITMVHERGLWLEVVTLIVPDFNDSDAELADIARFLVDLSPDIPWHVTAFHPDYKMRDRGWTQAETLCRAREIGVEAGLNHVYAGNIPGAVPGAEDTHCAGCGVVLIARTGYDVRIVTLEGNECRACGTVLPGVF
ncbi:MAG: AmmeMemoRadiSam system radical SAM enzyme [Planctomycetes bacterium]|nr:AmmeMemoRadiSam system radical SAM enzyme [Planctomycetota bacterium]MDP6423991.1 AmmeMemoRadiSam system radical SAM enzyme [Planctomycetota bacterium]